MDDEGEADLAAGKFIGRVRMLDAAIPAEEYGFAFRNGDTATKAAADKIITAKRENGEIAALFFKYNLMYKQVQTSGL